MRFASHPSAGKFAIDYLDMDLPDPLEDIIKRFNSLDQEVGNILFERIRPLESKTHELQSQLATVSQQQAISGDDDFLVFDTVSSGQQIADFSQYKIACGFQWYGVAADAKHSPIIRILAGTLHMHGVANTAVPQTDVTLLDASQVWVYVEVARAGWTLTVKCKVTEPVTDATNIEYPLYRFDRVTEDAEGPPIVYLTYKLGAVLHWGDPVLNPVLDGLSMDTVATTNSAQSYQWATLANGVWVSGDGLFTRPTTKGAGKYLPITELATALVTATGDGGAGWGVPGGIGTLPFYHSKLKFTDSVTGIALNNRDHSSQHPDIAGTYTGDATTHYGAAAFASIGNALYAEKIRFATGTAATGTNYLLHGADGAAAIWQVGLASDLPLLKILSAVAYAGTNGVGALQVTGGINFQQRSGGVNGTYHVDLLSGTAAASFTDEVSAADISKPAVGSYPACGFFTNSNISAVKYYTATHPGKTEATGDLFLFKADGTPVQVYIRGGLVCDD